MIIRPYGGFMKASDVLIPSRRVLLDDMGQKWGDLVLLGFLADGIREMFAVRPDFLLGSDGVMGGNDINDVGDVSQVRVHGGKLEVWDTVLEAWIGVSMQDGALVSMSAAADGDVPVWTADDVLVSWDTDIGVGEVSLRFALQEYVVGNALMSYAMDNNDLAAAQHHVDKFYSKLGVRF